MGQQASAALIAVGDELLEGRHVDTNSSQLARALFELGFAVERVQLVGDDEQALAALYAELAGQHALLISTGGLGPTLDDVTRHAAARAAGVVLEEHPRARQALEAWWTRRQLPMPEANLRQALLPRGAELLDNEWGTAPGFALHLGRAWLCALPGPPREMLPMLERHVLPRLRAWPGLPSLERASFYLCGLPESSFAQAVGDWMARGANPLMGVTASDSILSVTLLARAASAAEARALLAPRTRELRERFAQHLFSESSPELGRALGAALLACGTSISLAESCTGGLATELLTRQPGISAVLRESFVTYHAEAKIERLGVPRALIEAHGVVSPEVALAMAQGAARVSGARLALSTTGIAGPGGGTPEHPEGEVCLGVVLDGRGTSHLRRFPPGDRQRVRQFAANAALWYGLCALRS